MTDSLFNRTIKKTSDDLPSNGTVMYDTLIWNQIHLGLQTDVASSHVELSIDEQHWAATLRGQKRVA